MDPTTRSGEKATDEVSARSELQPPRVAPLLPNEKAQRAGAGASSSVELPAAEAGATHVTAAVRPPGSNLSLPVSPPRSPPVSRPSMENRSSPSRIENYYASRPKFDRLGNPIPERRRPGAASGGFGPDNNQVRLPGDLGAKDPRRPRSPAPSTLPGDLGPNDPRRSTSLSASPVPGGRPHVATDASGGTEDGGRLQEDPPEAPDELRDSDDDADADNDNDTDADETKRGRGRKRPEPGRTTSGKSVNVRDDSADSDGDGSIKPDPTKGESKLSFQRDPKIKVTPPSEKKRVHPSTAFDVAPSGASTPLGSDAESHSEIRAAQKLSLTMSAIHSTPSAHRVIRQIIRGDYAHFQREAEDGRKRQRMYLVATDLSPESEYALEWTIGTVLRDGDTLFAVYAVDEETGVSAEGGVEIGHGAESVRDTAAIVRALPTTTHTSPPSPGPSPLGRPPAAGGPGLDGRSRSRGGGGGPSGSADVERRRALEDITHRCVQLLRKTRLQVRVVVEVFHCKSPRHMITEVIDFLAPTLVVIGSRGRSAVKGVLLGSFSNYLVTKSSVPVMVARKKLRKHAQSVRRNKDGTLVPYSGSGRSGRFSNVIEAPKGRGLRVQGWDQVGID